MSSTTCLLLTGDAARPSGAQKGSTGKRAAGTAYSGQWTKLERLPPEGRARGGDRRRRFVPDVVLFPAAGCGYPSTTDLQIKAQMTGQGYTAEGYGPSATIMCAPQ
jgi:hypothetical protein